MKAITCLCFFLLSFSAVTPYQTDYFVLALSWPPAVCSSSPCINYFTIHGLWPQCYAGNRHCNGGKEPVECTSSAPKFNLASLQKDKSLVQSLQMNWPSLVKGRTSEEFWGYEWNKHGTCSYDLLSQNAYFWLTIHLLDVWKIELGNALTAAGLFKDGPSRKLTYVQKKFHDTLKVRTEIVCGLNSDGIAEVRFCFDHTGQKVIDCPFRWTCGASETNDPFIYLGAE